MGRTMATTGGLLILMVTSTATARGIGTKVFVVSDPSLETAREDAPFIKYRSPSIHQFMRNIGVKEDEPEYEPSIPASQSDWEEVSMACNDGSGGWNGEKQEGDQGDDSLEHEVLQSHVTRIERDEGRRDSYIGTL